MIVVDVTATDVLSCSDEAEQSISAAGLAFHPSGVDIMRELKPYRTMHGLRKAVDNGGRFYNFFTERGRV